MGPIPICAAMPMWGEDVPGADIFISYARKDVETARRFAQAFKQQSRDIGLADHWQQSGIGRIAPARSATMISS